MKKKKTLNTFSKREYRSIVMTISIVILGILLPPYATRLVTDNSPPSITLQLPPLVQAESDTLPKPLVVSDNTRDTRQPTALPLASSLHRSPVDINSADSLEWKRLPGIGNVLSKRVVKFRDKLGGFYSIDQVAQTYGLSPETFERIRPDLVRRTEHSKIDMRDISVSELAGHPYISWDQARKLDALIREYGDTLPAQLLKTAGDSIWVAKIRPYLHLKDKP